MLRSMVAVTLLLGACGEMATEEMPLVEEDVGTAQKPLTALQPYKTQRFACPGQIYTKEVVSAFWEPSTSTYAGTPFAFDSESSPSSAGWDIPSTTTRVRGFYEIVAFPPNYYDSYNDRYETKDWVEVRCVWATGVAHDPNWVWEPADAQRIRWKLPVKSYCNVDYSKQRSSFCAPPNGVQWGASYKCMKPYTVVCQIPVYLEPDPRPWP